MKNYLKWEYFKRFMEISQFLIVILGVCFSVYQIKDIANNQLSKRNELSMLYFDRLNSGINRKISIAIESQKLFSKGITSNEIDDFLNDLHGVGKGLDRGLLDPEIVCSDFSDITIKAYKNKEIQDYISLIRKEDEAYFQGFDNLYNFLTTSCE